MFSLVVLISGGGSNLRAVLHACRDPEFPARVVAVGADRDADGLAHAEEYGVSSFTVPYGSFASRDEWGAELLEQVTGWQPDLVVLSGFMRLLPAAVVTALAPALINTHPSYLPAFPGASAVRDALAAGEAETGASVIVVDDGVDTGPVIAQERVPILPADTEPSLHERIKVVERRLLLQVIEDVAAGRTDLRHLAPQDRTVGTMTAQTGRQS